MRNDFITFLLRALIFIALVIGWIWMGGSTPFNIRQTRTSSEIAFLFGWGAYCLCFVKYPLFGFSLINPRLVWILLGLGMMVCATRLHGYFYGW